MLNSLRKQAPVTLSLLAGAVLWEIVGRNSNPAFLVPLSETLVRLWQLVGTREFVVQFLDSATPQHEPLKRAAGKAQQGQVNQRERQQAWVRQRVAVLRERDRERPDARPRRRAQEHRQRERGRVLDRLLALRFRSHGAAPASGAPTSEEMR